MPKSDKLKGLHEKRGFKHYSFGNFYPVEKAKVYKRGNTCQFVLLSLDEKFLNTLSQALR